MTLQAASADLLTGRLIADLPSLDPQWPLRNTISAANPATATLHLEGAPENWERAILEGGSQIFFYDDTVFPDGSQPKPIAWCGYVVEAPREADSDDVDLTLATFEAVLDWAYVGDLLYTTDWNRDDIIADLVNRSFQSETNIAYLQMAYTLGNGPTPAVMDSPPVPDAALIYQRADAVTLQARIDQVVQQLGGEYAVTWGWSPDGQSIVPTLRFGDRFGIPAPTGLGPGVTFETPGIMFGFKEGRSYAAGAGANEVVTYSSGQADTVPFSDPAIAANLEGRPKRPYWYQPAASVSKGALNQYAQQALKVLAPGKRPISFSYSTVRDTGRKLGLDWNLGDDIGYRVAPGTVRAFPDGREGVGRAIGYEITDPTTVTPILADSVIYQAGG